jgi:hypothetical protein
MIGRAGAYCFEEIGFTFEGDCIYFSHRIKAKKNLDLKKAVSFLSNSFST